MYNTTCIHSSQLYTAFGATSCRLARERSRTQYCSYAHQSVSANSIRLRLSNLVVQMSFSWLWGVVQKLAQFPAACLCPRWLSIHFCTKVQKHFRVCPRSGDLQKNASIPEGVKWSEVKWGEVRWGEGKWGEVKWSEVRWGEVKWSEGKLSEVKWSETCMPVGSPWRAEVNIKRQATLCTLQCPSDRLLHAWAQKVTKCGIHCWYLLNFWIIVSHVFRGRPVPWCPLHGPGQDAGQPTSRRWIRRIKC